jgi:hypothetical protein
MWLPHGVIHLPYVAQAPTWCRQLHMVRVALNCKCTTWLHSSHTVHVAALRHTWLPYGPRSVHAAPMWCHFACSMACIFGSLLYLTSYTENRVIAYCNQFWKVKYHWHHLTAIADVSKILVSGTIHFSLSRARRAPRAGMSRPVHRSLRELL